MAKVSHGHWKTTTFLAALRHDGLYAPPVLDGAITGDLFRAYVQQQLVPTLQPGDLVILDNLSAHKVSGVRSAIEAAQARVVYGPPYSPDFNPIEQVFAGWRRLLPTAAERTAPAAMIRDCLIVLWFAAEGHRRYRAPWRPWYRTKSGACFTAMLHTLRIQSVRHQFLSLHLLERGHKKIMKTLHHAVQRAA